MKKTLLTAFAAVLALNASAEIEGVYQAVTYFGYELNDSYKFDTTAPSWSSEDKDAEPWYVTITKTDDGYTVENLIDWEETLTATYDEATGCLSIAGGSDLGDGYALCGGLGSSANTADAIMSLCNSYSSYVPSKTAKPVVLKVEGTRIICTTPIFTYYASTQYSGYMGYANDCMDGLVLSNDENAVKAIEADDVNAPVEFFNLQGVRVANPAAGQLVIKRQGNTVVKTVVR